MPGLPTTAVAIAAAVRAGEVSAVEVLDAHLAVIDAREGEINAFNLVLADADGCWHLGNHPSQREKLASGVHGISNGRLDAPWPKTRCLGDALRTWIDAGRDDLESLWNALADERIAPDAELPDTGVGIELERKLSPAFIRGEAYGTRASTIVMVDHEGRAFIVERRFGPNGAFEGETTLRNDD